MQFLISFGMCKKSTKNEKSSTLGADFGRVVPKNGRVGGRGGRPGNLVLLVQGKDFDTGV